MAPLIVNWFEILEKALPGASIKNIVAKSLITMLATVGLNNPCYITYSHVVHSLIKKEKVDWNNVRIETFDHMKKELPKLTKNGAAFWIPVTTLNYAVVPPSLRVYWTASCTVGYSEVQKYASHIDDFINQADVMVDNADKFLDKHKDTMRR